MTRALLRCHYSLPNLAGARLLGRSSREILVRPHKPVLHALMLGKALVGVFYDGIRGPTAPKDEHGTRFSIALVRQANDDTIFYLWLAVKGGFQILRVHVHSRRSNDHIFFAA